MAVSQPSVNNRFSISVAPDRAEVAVIPSGELDLASARLLEEEVRELQRVGFSRIVLDLRQLVFLDSTGLRSLLTLRNDAKRDGHHLELMPGPRQVQRVFEITATRGLFDWR